MINGDGNFSRDFTYVDNVTFFNRLAIESEMEINYNVFNVAFGSRISILEMAKLIKEKLSLKNPNIKNIDILHQEERKGDIPHSIASIQKAKRIINYLPKVDFNTGLEKTINWFWKNYENR